MFPLNVASATQGFRITLAGATIQDVVSNGINARASVVFGLDGNMYQELGNPTPVRSQFNAATDWARPTIRLTEYEVMATLTSGSPLDGGSDTLGSWLPTGFEYAWFKSLTANNQERISNVTIQVRHATSLVVQDTGLYVLRVQIGTP